MIDLTIKLLIAHIIGDFVLQPNKWVQAKKRKSIQVKIFLPAWFHSPAITLRITRV